MKIQVKLTATAAIERLKADDPELVSCDLSNNAVLQMKASDMIPRLADALAGNSHCRELNLTACNLDDACCEKLAAALAGNHHLASLVLEGNRCGNEGATHIASALRTNRGLMMLNLLNQKGSRFGDSTLAAFTGAFDSNITLLKIIWRLESRQSFRLNKL
ncbi:hypothetical protein EMIHUDRAFT_255174, partial [Emiliania huxleyi CCMP1516]